jgi:hypothetical protein
MRCGHFQGVEPNLLTGPGSIEEVVPSRSQSPADLPRASDDPVGDAAMTHAPTPPD